MPAFDPRVYDIQYWLNATYAGQTGFRPAPDDGKTGWATMQSLTTALQIEVGVPSSQISTSFGPLTLSLLTSKFGHIGPTTNTTTSGFNVVQMVKGALYCKGYSGGSYDGQYSSTVEQSVQTLRNNMGYTDTRSTLAPIEFKALLNMDAYVLIGGGRADVRDVQQWYNRTYAAESWFSIIPTDGYFSRDVQKGIVYALQKELRISGPTGSVGPATLATLQARSAINVGNSDAGSSVFIRLFQALLRFNRFTSGFDGQFSSSDSTQVSTFQSFMMLPLTGKGDYQSWCSLLMSSGDVNRAAAACDTSTPLTAGKASALYTAGYRTVGRYLTNATSTGALNKKLQPGELAIIKNAGLTVYPIFQTYGGSASYFTAAQGTADAQASLTAARGYGFPKDTTIYFAIDFDATDAEITTSVIPHFRGIRSTFASAGDYYRVGVYGSRNPCSRLADEGLAEKSMILGMSNGYSGNLGFTMPDNWAWDQFTTTTVGTGTSAITIDKNAASGRDQGYSPNAEPTGLDVGFDITQLAALRDLVWDKGELSKELDDRVLSTSDVKNSVDRVIGQDAFVTGMSRQFGIRKALIQTVATWEDWRVNPFDIAADLLVQESHAYRLALLEAIMNGGIPPLPPLIEKYDSSTGFSQISAGTAIRARNWAIQNGLMNGSSLDPDNDNDIWLVWQQLHGDMLYNLGTVPAVLMWGAADIGITGAPRTDYTEGQVKAILARYNGTGTDAETYGEATYLLYQAFEQFNADLRS